MGTIVQGSRDSEDFLSFTLSYMFLCQWQRVYMALLWLKKMLNMHFSIQWASILSPECLLTLLCSKKGNICILLLVLPFFWYLKTFWYNQPQYFSKPLLNFYMNGWNYPAIWDALSLYCPWVIGKIVGCLSPSGSGWDRPDWSWVPTQEALFVY